MSCALLENQSYPGSDGGVSDRGGVGIWSAAPRSVSRSPPARNRYTHTISAVTRLLDATAAGDRKAAADPLPLVYDELRKLAATRLAEEKPGQTLQATALVHEAYLRLAGVSRFESKSQYVCAAA